MEWQEGHKGLPQFVSQSVDMIASSMSHLHEDDFHQPATLASGSIDGLPLALPLSMWIQDPQTSCDRIKFLGDVLTLPYKDVPEGIHSLSDIHSMSGFNESQREILYNNSLKSTGFRPGCFSHDTNALRAHFLKPHDEELFDRAKSTDYNFCGQTNNSWMPKPIKGKDDDSLPPSGTNVSKSCYLSKGKISPRLRATTNDRRRKLRIEERLAALHQLIPHSNESDKASLLDDIIDHIKLLQLHIKELSRTRLEGPPTADQFVFLEGYGHFLVHEQMVQEPLEEMMGKLLEVNPSMAAALLESRGLSMMPMAMAEGLPRVP